jgi:hypothetical protein
MATQNCPADIKPLSQSELIKNNQITNLNYTNQDFWSMKTRLVEFMNERFGTNGTVLPNVFNDLVESDLAIMLMENWAFLADTLSFKMDQIANEFFLDTVTETDNAFRLARLIGFEPTPPLPSRSKWTATLTSALDEDVVLNTPVIVNLTTEQGPTRIELFPTDANFDPIFDEQITIPPNTLIIDNIIGLEGRTSVVNYSGTGEPLQTYSTPEASIIYDSIEVQVDGSIWEKVDYFTDSQLRKEYRVEYDSIYRAYIMFGNNARGLSPSPGANVQITYRIGGGTHGNIVTGYIETQRQAVVPGLPYTVPVGLRNYTPGQYGYDGDTIEDVRRKLPVWIRTQDRAVTGEDYKTLADLFVTPYHGQVGKSHAVLRNKGCAANVVDLYVLAKDGVSDLIEASDELKTALYEELDDKKMVTDHVCIKDGTVLEVDVSIEAIVSRLHRKFEQEIKTAIENEADAYFDLTNWEYGQDLTSAGLIKALSGIERISSYEVTYVTDDDDNSGEVVAADYYEIIRPDTITISIMYE